MAPRIVSCPTCGASVEWTQAATHRPFCSERCKLIDAGAWASEAYRVPVSESPDGEERDRNPGDPKGRRASS
jgi:endogenous inhibitor of DNA gyrase (YacG/DUF329 family)